jgi:hydrogenase/urease accessory protein HupE
MSLRLSGLLLGLSLLWPVAQAHPLAPAMLELRQLPAAEGSRYAVQWRISATQVRGSVLEPRLPADCRPVSAVQASAAENQSLVRRWQVQCGATGLVGRSIGISGLEQSPINVILRIETLAGEADTHLLDAAQASYTVPVAAGIPPVFRSYLGLGVEHLLSGLDHVLFLAGLLLLVRKLRPLVLTVTAFTLGHSVTLALATLGLVRVNSALTELAIALSILVLAHEVLRPHPRSLMRRWPWLMAGAFGLLHGLGFAGALAEVGLPTGEIPLALFAFNVGIEIGQLLLVMLALLLSRVWSMAADRHWPALAATAQMLLLPYFIGALAGYWCIERAVAIFA